MAGLSPLALLALAAGAIVAVTLARGLATLLSNYVTIEVGQRMVNDLRTDLYAHLQKLSLRFHHRQQSGDLLFRVMADTYSAQGIVMNGLLPLASAGVMLFGMFAVMANFDLQLSLVALLVCPALYLAITRISRRIHQHAEASKAAESELYVRTQTTIGAVKLVQAYGREEGAVADFRRGSERSLALNLRLYSMETVFVLVVDALLAVGTAALVFLGALRVMEGRLHIGELTIFLSYLRDLYQPIQGISQNLAEISSARVGLERVFSVLNVEPDVQDAPDAHPLPPARGRLRFENVSFAYEPGTPVLRQVDLELQPGEKVALVGKTGAGKSTLASLALRFFDPQEGRVSLDGHDLREVTLASLRRDVTLLLQEPLLFHTTVWENIAFGAGASPERIRAAARQAEAESFILELPQGYDTVLGEGGVEPVRRPAPAARARAGPPARHAGGGARRAHELARPRDRGRGLAERHGAVPGEDRAHHRPPPEHGPRGRPDRGARGRRDRRAGLPRRAPGARRGLRRPLAAARAKASRTSTRALVETA